MSELPAQPSLRRMKAFGIRPNRDLGQNFLIDSNLLEVISRAAELGGDDVDVAGALGEVLGQYAEPAADLEHDVVGAQLGGARDHLEQVRVDQEVLAEVPVRADPERLHAAQARLRGELAHQPNSRAALASTAASSSS